MTTSSNVLERPLTLRRLTLKNRLAKAALSEGLASRDGSFSHALLHLYTRWAESGAGLSFTGNVMIDRLAVAEPGNVVIDETHDMNALKRWSGLMQRGGGAAFVQINHPGRQALRFLNRETVAPSAVALRGMAGMFPRPRPLTDREIRALIERFAHCAVITRDAGFSGVQIHAAHGYLISQFLSPLTNLRDDDWGGDADRRARFLREVVRSVRSAVGPDFPVSVKLNSADFQRGGFNEEESLRVVDLLATEGVDLLEISGGTYESTAFVQEHGQRESTRAREAFFLDYAERVRSRTKLPLMLSGGFRSRQGMEEALVSGSVDLIGLGRPLIVMPDFCARLLRGELTRAPDPQLSTGFRFYDTFLQNAWYRAQLRRLARGLPPDLTLSRSWATLRYLAPLAVDRSPLQNACFCRLNEPCPGSPRATRRGSVERVGASCRSVSSARLATC